MECKTKIKIIETKDIPEGKQVGKTSKVPEILKQIPKGKTAEIENSATQKIATIRSYIEKKHATGEELEYSIVQRSIEDKTQPKGKKTILYITHETNKLPKPEPKQKKPSKTDIPIPKYNNQINPNL